MRSVGALIAIALVCGACAAPARERTAILSDRAVVLELPIVEQDEMYECGLVSVSALCRYWGVALPTADEDDLARLAREEQGLSGAELCDVLGRNGFDAYLFEGTLERGPTSLLTQVDARRPLLVMISPEEKRHHYVLFLGYDEENANACLLDPVRGRVVLPLNVFEKTWRECDHFTLLAIPKDASANDKEVHYEL